MPQRFTIEEIEVQDSSGVIFRAVDTTTEDTVAVRRFFPFGPTGGGLTADEQDQYVSVLEHLETISHPSLRTIVGGGCDPVDGIPFIATEWVEGVSLRHILAERNLSMAEATALLVHALDACEVLSEVLGREGVWIETDPQTIIIGSEQAQRPISFWISPLRWLGQLSGQRGMAPLVTLTETAMGWSGEPPQSHGVSGLAGWLEWLRKADRTTSLDEARSRLLATANKESGPAAHRPDQHASPATQPDAKHAKKKPRSAAWILGCGVLIAVGLAGWVMIQKNQQRVAEAAGPPPSIASVPRHVATQESDTADSDSSPLELEVPVSPPGGGERTPEEMTLHAEQRMAEANKADEVLNERQEAVRKRGEVYLPREGDLLSKQQKGSVVKLKGRIARVHTTKAGNVYLSFSRRSRKNEPRAYVLKDDLTPELTEATLKRLVGRTIQMEGILRTIGNRPEVRIQERSSIIEP